MFKKLAEILKSERGITTPEAMMISGLIAVLALLTWQTLRPVMPRSVNSAGVIGNKTFNAVNTGNNASW